MLRDLLAIVILTVGILSCSGNSSDWVRQDAPIPEGQFAEALWVFAEDDVWLGGISAWHFDGAEWTEHALPVPGVVLDFWGFASDDLWAIGGDAVFRWNGTNWSEVPQTEGVLMTAPTKIWGESSTAIWIANSNNSRVYHWDGIEWDVKTLQFVVATAMWGSSSSDIWLAGNFNSYHWNGAIWTEYDAPFGTAELLSVSSFWGFGPTDIWASTGRNQLTHWDGVTWTAVVNDDLEDYAAIWGPSPDNIIAVGRHGEAVQYDGDNWRIQSPQLKVHQNFVAIHGSSATNIWAIAFDLKEARSLVLRYQP